MHRNKSVMVHQFSRVPKAQIPRSSFDRSHGHKTTFDAGLLIPVFVDEALPGDTFKMNMTAFARLATPIFPIMDNMYMDTQFFSVPIRLLFDNWQKLNGEQTNPGDSTDYLTPVLANATFTEGSIFDYMGLPVGIPTSGISALPLRAYNLVYNEWYRDQNLIDSVPRHVGDGPDPVADYELLRRAKRPDYFTTSLPFPQKGPGVQIPLGSSAPVITGLDHTTGVVTNPMKFMKVDGNGPSNNSFLRVNGTGQVHNDTTTAVGTLGLGQYPSNLYADLTQATAATINSLRQAFQVQKIFERDARGGTRYIEIIKAHFGVDSPDARLQRPEYLGGGSTPVNIRPIPQTSATGAYAQSPQGNLSAMGTALASGHGFTASFTEHCIIIGLLSVRADLTYQQGLNRMWSRRTRFDFYWPALSHIGEQAVLNKEIFYQGNASDELAFGYQERYAEYRYKPSLITGAFRSTSATPLDAWHLSQEFSTLPVLDQAFIEENPPVDRIIAVDTEPHFLCDMYFKMHCARPMPLYGEPGLIDHF
ncbi:MAG: major capsid protein [Microviridae sp.]|nr:MAG: major capsid protein [Microviridae sp.]